MKKKYIPIILVLLVLALIICFFFLSLAKKETLAYSYVRNNYYEFHIEQIGILITTKGNIYSIDQIKDVDLTNFISLNNSIKGLEPIGKVAKEDMKKLDKEVKKLGDNTRTKNTEDTTDLSESDSYYYNQINFYDKDGNIIELYYYDSNNNVRYKDAIDKNVIPDLLNNYFFEMMKD